MSANSTTMGGNKTKKLRISEFRLVYYSLRHFFLTDGHCTKARCETSATQG